MIKRLLDLVSASLGLSVLSPILGVIALGIKHEDGGPVFYRGVRVGLQDKPFRMFKFRTMVVDADKFGGPSTSDDDARVTRIGRVLRRYKLDELPQLINVITGDMSLVGPRPEIPSEVQHYTPEEKQLLTVRPGMTDFASIRFHNEGELLQGYPDTHEAYTRLIRPEKLRLGLEYVRTQSFLTDLKIIALTFKTLMETRK